MRTMKSFVLEIDDGYGLLEFEVPADATDDEIADLESLVPRLDAGCSNYSTPLPVSWCSAAGPSWCESRLAAL